MKTLILTMALIFWATTGSYPQDGGMPGKAPKEIVFNAVLCKADCGPGGLKFKAFILNNTNGVVALEKFALKARLTLSYQPAKTPKNKGSGKAASEAYKTLSILPGGTFAEDSIRLDPNEIYGIEQKLILDSSHLDACSAKSIKVYGNLPIHYDNLEWEIAVNQDLKNNCDF